MPMYARTCDDCLDPLYVGDRAFAIYFAPAPEEQPKKVVVKDTLKPNEEQPTDDFQPIEEKIVCVDCGTPVADSRKIEITI